MCIRNFSKENLLSIIVIVKMDMFASFYAGSYAVYNRMNSQRRQELYPNVGYYSPQIPQLIPLQTVSNSQISTNSSHEQNDNKQKKTSKVKQDEPSATSNDRMKFSIDSILNEPSTSSKSKFNEDSDESEDEDDKLPWLQCTRYKPPKLPSK